MKHLLKIQEMSKIIIAFYCLALLLLNPLIAQQKTISRPLIQDTVSSKVLDEERLISIYLPKNYESSEKKFPVLYLLDGYVSLQVVTTAVDLLSHSFKIPQMIVVAIHNVDRIRDFAPVYVEEYPNSGGGDKFLEFISNELIGYMDTNYKSADFKVFIGMSGGGGFVTYSFISKPEVFNSYIAISPYLQWYDNYIVKLASKKQLQKFNSQKHFYMTVGNEPEYFNALDEFAQLVENKGDKTLNFKYEKFFDENHWSIPYLGTYYGLRHTFSEWTLNQSKNQ